MMGGPTRYPIRGGASIAPEAGIDRVSTARETLSLNEAFRRAQMQVTSCDEGYAMVVLNGPGDIELRKTVSGGRDSLPSRQPPTFAILAFVPIAFLIGAVAFLLFRGARPERGQQTAAPAAAAVKVRQVPTEVTILPPLAETDALVRELVRALSAHPVVAAWLANEQLIVNFVVVTGKIADGQTPAAELQSIGPIAPFQARAARSLSIDQSSYRRYDPYAQAVAALDAGGVARLYETIKPRVNEADRNFGGAGAFDAVLERAIVELLQVPIVEGDVAIRPAGIGYALADPTLEGMSGAQKQLFRMGPDNVRAIQQKLREIASALGIPESRLPRPSR